MNQYGNQQAPARPQQFFNWWMNHWCNQNLIQQIQGSDGEDPPLLSTPASDEAFLVGCDLCLWEASSLPRSPP